MSGEENETETEAQYMLLGDTYADIMYAQQLISELPGRDTAVYETWLISWGDQLQEMFDHIADTDADTLAEQASDISDRILAVISDLEQLR